MLLDAFMHFNSIVVVCWVHSEYLIFPLEYLFNMQVRNTCMFCRLVRIRGKKAIQPLSPFAWAV